MDDFLTFFIVDNATGNSYYFTGISNVSGGKSSTVTQYPTPSGKKISDHLYVNPRQLSFQLTTSRIAMNPCKRIVGAPWQPYRKIVDNSYGSVQDIKDTFNTWVEEGNRLTITTFEDFYENMVLTDIRVTEDSNGIGIWSPVLSFREVRIATPEYIKLPFAQSNKEGAASNDEQNAGPNNGNSAGEVGETIGYAGSGALLGAAIGSVIPVIGPATGAVIGGVAGFFTSLFR